MNKALASLALVASLAFSTTATAADNTVVGVGTGAVAGAVVAGPVGAVVGAVAGGFIGANTPSARSRYRRRARVTNRRRAAEQPAPRRARFAERAAPSASDLRPVSTQPARVRPPAADAAPDAPAPGTRHGSTWTDPH